MTCLEISLSYEKILPFENLINLFSDVQYLISWLKSSMFPSLSPCNMYMKNLLRGLLPKIFSTFRLLVTDGFLHTAEAMARGAPRQPLIAPVASVKGSFTTSAFVCQVSWHYCSSSSTRPARVKVPLFTRGARPLRPKLLKSFPRVYFNVKPFRVIYG